MRTIILAAGYATRLGELTRNCPKPLLRIGSKSILDRMLKDIDRIPDIEEHIIVTNHKFTPAFEAWRQNAAYSKPVTIIDDGSTTNETRLGAVCDLQLAIRHLQERSRNAAEPQPIDLLVVAADNLLFFSFQEFVDFAREKGTSCIMCHEQNDVEKLRRTGVILTDSDMRVLEMAEKPQNPKSNLAVPPFYIYLDRDIDAILHATENGCGTDAPGNLAHYLSSRTTLHAWPMTAGRFDIGSIDTYHEAVEKFS